MIWMKSRVRRRSRARTVVDEVGEPGDEAIVADAQERPARDVADAGRLDDDRAGLPLGEAAVPVEHVRRDEAVLGRAPRHHRRHPGALLEPRLVAEREGRQEHRRSRLLGRRHAGDGDRVLDALRRFPHGRTSGAAGIEDALGDDELLDLGRAFVDAQRPNLAVERARPRIRASRPFRRGAARRDR